jgi:anti-sigma B factor antagonist/stage II sporulation protein AA (anti-sigma F factor antagonist)
VKTAKVNVQQHDAGPVICVRGEIDLSNSDALRGDIVAAVPHDGPGIVLDLTETTYLDSSGVRLLFELAELLQQRRQRLVLVVSEEALIRRVVVLTKLDDAVSVVESIDAGLAALAPV